MPRKERVSPGMKEHAIVIGGSMAGLLAARVLSDRFERVTIVERDRFPDGAEARRGVPQGRHAHALLPRGFMIMARLFPGIAEELVSDGAIASDVPAESLRYQLGGYRVHFSIGRKSLLMSRPFLEGHIRRRVRALPGVTVLEEHAVTGLLSGEDEKSVGGVTVRRRVQDAPERRLVADLVVDASGRGSRAPAWLEEMGYERPEEERIEIGVGYTTRIYRSRPDDLSGVKFVIIEPTPGRERSIGAMFRMEDERWIVTLGGWLGERAPTDEAGFVEFARNLPAPDIHEVIKDAEPLGDAVKFNFPANLRRRYERVSRLPAGYLVTGDALCSFNPIYGQGMSVAALEAETLEKSLADGLEDLPRRFYRRVSEVVDVPWKLAAGADFAHPGVTGSRALTTGIVNWYVGHVRRAISRDEEVCRVFTMVTGLLEPPSALFRPRIALRVFRQMLVRDTQTAASPRLHREPPEAVPASDAA
jgi:2-polyprenyl-6-methoxyphenol hydroxylase-like FAD-dependent oxidoreductase